MVRSGRISTVLLLVIVALAALVGVIFFFRGENYMQSATQFMDALSRGDTAKLSELSHIDGNDKAQIKEKWDKTFRFGKHFKFIWTVKSGRETGADSAVVTLTYWRSPDLGGYDEKFEVPLIKKDGKWLVEVRGLSRQMFPALPR